MDVSIDLTLVDLLNDDPLDIDAIELDTMSVDTTIASTAASAANEVMPGFTSLPKASQKQPSSEEKSEEKENGMPTTGIENLKLSRSEIKEKIMARANSDMMADLTSTPEYNQTQPNTFEKKAHTPKCTLQEGQEAPMTSKKKLKLTGPAVLENVMALNNSAVSSLDTETEYDSNSLFSSQE